MRSASFLQAQTGHRETLRKGMRPGINKIHRKKHWSIAFSRTERILFREIRPLQRPQRRRLLASRPRLVLLLLLVS